MDKANVYDQLRETAEKVLEADRLGQTTVDGQRIEELVAWVFLVLDGERLLFRQIAGTETSYENFLEIGRKNLALQWKELLDEFEDLTGDKRAMNRADYKSRAFRKFERAELLKLSERETQALLTRSQDLGLIAV